MSKLIARIGRECVACGNCVKVCPREALSIVGGMYARVDGNLCVGCGRCVKECPGGLIQIAERGKL